MSLMNISIFLLSVLLLASSLGVWLLFQRSLASEPAFIPIPVKRRP